MSVINTVVSRASAHSRVYVPMYRISRGHCSSFYTNVWNLYPGKAPIGAYPGHYGTSFCCQYCFCSCAQPGTLCTCSINTAAHGKCALWSSRLSFIFCYIEGLKLQVLTMLRFTQKYQLFSGSGGGSDCVTCKCSKKKDHKFNVFRSGGRG